MSSNETPIKVQKHESYGSYTAIAVLLPVIGLILGIVYMAKDEKLDRKFGEHLLAVSILFLILWGIVWVVWGTYSVTV